MTSFAHERVRQAEQLVRNAADRWDATDSAAIEDCASALESSIAQLTAASEDMLAERLNRTEDPAYTTRAALRALKSDAARLQRLVDAAAAFLRNLPGGAGEDIELYRASGSPAAFSTGLPVKGLQG